MSAGQWADRTKLRWELELRRRAAFQVCTGLENLNWEAVGHMRWTRTACGGACVLVETGLSSTGPYAGQTRGGEGEGL